MAIWATKIRTNKKGILLTGPFLLNFKFMERSRDPAPGNSGWNGLTIIIFTGDLLPGLAGQPGCYLIARVTFCPPYSHLCTPALNYPRGNKGWFHRWGRMFILFSGYWCPSHIGRPINRHSSWRWPRSGMLMHYRGLYLCIFIDDVQWAGGKIISTVSYPWRMTLSAG